MSISKSILFGMKTLPCYNYIQNTILQQQKKKIKKLGHSPMVVSGR